MNKINTIAQFKGCITETFGYGLFKFFKNFLDIIFIFSAPVRFNFITNHYTFHYFSLLVG